MGYKLNKWQSQVSHPGHPSDHPAHVLSLPRGPLNAMETASFSVKQV